MDEPIIYPERLKMVKLKVAGIAEPLWTTEAQWAKLFAMRNDPRFKRNLVKVGAWSFSPADIITGTERTVANYEIPAYARKRVEFEKKSLENGEILQKTIDKT